MTAHTFLVTSCLAGPSLLTHPLPGIYLCLEKRVGPSIFSYFSSFCGTGVAFSYPCWSPRALMSKTLLSASSRVISQQLLLPTALPSFMALPGSSCLRAAAAHRLSFCHLDTASLSAGGGWLWTAPAALSSPRDGFSRARLWPQVCGRRSWSCWIFGFAPKKTCLPWDLILMSYQFLCQLTALISWIIDQLPRGHVVVQVEWNEYSSPRQADSIPSMVR